jgi:hypothetical protein
MRKFSLFVFTSFILLIGCQSNDKEYKAQVEFKNVNQLITKSFSDLNVPDTFKIELTGRYGTDF